MVHLPRWECDVLGWKKFHGVTYLEFGKFETEVTKTIFMTLSTWIADQKDNIIS